MQTNLCKIMLAKKSLHCYSRSMDIEHETSEAAAGESAAASADTPARHDRVLDLTSLKALAHPLRVQILDELSTYGPATASGLAAKLGESSGATSYHLRQLEKNGFVAEDTERGVGRERWWRRVPGGISVDIDRLPGGQCIQPGVRGGAPGMAASPRPAPARLPEPRRPHAEPRMARVQRRQHRESQAHHRPDEGAHQRADGGRRPLSRSSIATRTSPVRDRCRCTSMSSPSSTGSKFHRHPTGPIRPPEMSVVRARISTRERGRP